MIINKGVTMLTDDEFNSMLASNDLDDLEAYFSPNIMGVSQYELDSLKEMI
tara:strand:+ start:1634 stop:1786 length:153 start_codon:yes stop_codon:yes gene_type:complete